MVDSDRIRQLQQPDIHIFYTSVRMSRANTTETVYKPGRVAQSVGHLTSKSGVLGSITYMATYFRFSFRFFKMGSCQLLAKYVHEVLVNRLDGLSRPRKSVFRLTDRPDMTLENFTVDVKQQYNNTTTDKQVLSAQSIN